MKGDGIIRAYKPIRTIALRQLENPHHLPPRDQPIDNQDRPRSATCAVSSSSNRETEWHRGNRPCAVPQPRCAEQPQSLRARLPARRDRFPGARLFCRSPLPRCSAHIDGKIPGVENLMNSALLSVAHVLVRTEIALASEPPVSVNAVGLPRRSFAVRGPDCYA